jgi:oligopeptide transport system substrate-binding protein
MHPLVRKAFPYIALAIGLCAVVYAISFERLPKADFSFQNGDQIKTLDPHKATGVPEHRVLVGLFEGLMREMPSPEGPDENGIVELEPVPGVASSFDLSEDGKVYTFHLRPNARWSDGTPVTADDFVWSWRRALTRGNAPDRTARTGPAAPRPPGRR